MLIATLHEQEIREAIGVPGEGDLVIDGVASLDAPEDRCVCFASGEIPAPARESLLGIDGCIVIVRPGSELGGELGSCRVLEAADPRAAIAKVLGLVQALGRLPAWVGAREISPDASISPLAAVEGNVTIAEGVQVEAFCTVGPDVLGRARLGDQVRGQDRPTRLDRARNAAWG